MIYSYWQKKKGKGLKAKEKDKNTFLAEAVCELALRMGSTQHANYFQDALRRKVMAFLLGRKIPFYFILFVALVQGRNHLVSTLFAALSAPAQTWQSVTRKLAQKKQVLPSSWEEWLHREWAETQGTNPKMCLWWKQSPASATLLYIHSWFQPCGYKSGGAMLKGISKTSQPTLPCLWQSKYLEIKGSFQVVVLLSHPGDKWD